MIIFTISWLKVVKNAHHNFPEPKLTSSFIQPAVQNPKTTHIINDKEKQQILTF